jgi:hypothetical protein
MKKLLLILFALLLLAPSMAAAQEADVITGRVIDDDGQPLVGARVEAISAETEIRRSVLTDRSGRFMINFPDGGGRYLLRITFLGKADIVRSLVREGDEELLVANVTMATQAIALEAVTATARRPQPSAGRTGEQTTEISQDMLNRLPLPDLDPNTVALLAAGVVATELDSISGRTGFSVAGMSDLLNQVMLDGMVLGESGLQVPQEGVRRTSVTTSTFDVSRGGFAGGRVMMTSTRGNNRVNGTLSYSVDDDAFQLGSAATVNAYSRQNIGGSLGGPVISNKLFYNVALGLQRNINHRFALAPNDDVAALRAGVATDSVNRFIGALLGYGIPVNGSGQYDQLRDNLSLQGRLDWNAIQKETQSHTISVRLNGSNSDEDSTRINALDLTQHGGEVEGDNWASALTINSRFGTNWTNALTASFNESWNNSLAYLQIPEGRVLVTSELDDDTRSTRTLLFGGNRNMPSDTYRKGLQLSNDLSFLLPIGTQLHRLKMGGMLQQTRSVNQSVSNIFGSFIFNSIEDLEQNAPVRFERTLADEFERLGAFNAGVYVGDTWRVSDPLELTVGLRWDYTRVDQTPAYNPAIEAAFGRRNDIEPSAAIFSPRLGFTYRLAASEGQRAARTLSGGIGLFAGQTPTNVYAAAARQTGLVGAEQRLVCIGAATPIPDWDAYLADPASIPSACADGGSGTTLSSRLPTVALINPDQKMPTSLRTEIAYRTRLPLNLSANFRYSYARGFGLWGYYDLNLDESQLITITPEGRPFFGDPSAIVSGSGQTTLAASRRFDQFGNVFDIRADRGSTAHQLTTQVNGQMPKGITLSANYTLSFARDQGSGNFLSAPTAGSPNTVEWAPSSQDRRHTLNLTLAKAFSPEIEVAAIARLSSGSPFTPMVGDDVNGDGVNNDRAFVFDASTTTDTSVVNGMARVLSAVPDRVADCLTEQTGGIAGRNSCRNSWSRALDMRASLRPNLPRLERRLTISVDATNILNGLDQLFNGDALRGWGSNERVDTRLLEVVGFNTSNNSFVYQVNEAFGQNRSGASAIRNPFALRISARLAVGGQPFMSNRGFGIPITAGSDFGGGGGGPGGGGPGGGPGGFGGGGARGGMLGMLRGENGEFNPDSAAARAFVNPIATVIELRDTLQLTEAQLAKLRALSDTLEAQLTPQRAKLREVLGGLDLSALERQRTRAIPGEGGGGPPAEVMRAMSALEPVYNAGRKHISDALQQARRELRPEQWQRLPLSLRGGGGAGRGFNAVGLMDRMLANPIPVMLELKDSLKLSPEQATQIRALSDKLQERLNVRREEMGKKLDSASATDQGRIFMELQPTIEATRKEVTDALTQVQRVLSAEQWQRIPEAVRNPFRGNNRNGGGR